MIEHELSALEILCGLDDYDTFRCSVSGQDPDRANHKLKARQRVCFASFENSGEMLAAIAARTSEDRAAWLDFWRMVSDEEDH